MSFPDGGAHGDWLLSVSCLWRSQRWLGNPQLELRAAQSRRGVELSWVSEGSLRVLKKRSDLGLEYEPVQMGSQFTVIWCGGGT